MEAIVDWVLNEMYIIVDILGGVFIPNVFQTIIRGLSSIPHGFISRRKCCKTGSTFVFVNSFEVMNNTQYGHRLFRFPMITIQ